LTIGVTGGEAFPQVLLDGTDDRTRAHLLQLGAYSRYVKNGSRLDGTIGFGGQSSKTTRLINDGVIAPTASARYDGRAFVSQVEYGHTIGLRNGFAIEPQAGFQYGRLSLDGVTEDGAGVLGLIVPDRVATTRRSLAGARIGRTFDNQTLPLMVEGRASWAHEFSLLRDVHMRFIGDATTNGFDLAAPNQLRDSAVVGFSIAGNRSKGLRVFANVDAEISGPMTGWSGNVGINKIW
jgi:outer membrane autotransporter protein